TDCKSIATVDGDSGSLKISNFSTTLIPNTICLWRINGTGKKDLKFHVDIEELVLGVNDTLEILDEKTQNKTIWKGTGSQWPGVILLGGSKYSSVLVKLSTSDEKISREWHVGYATTSPSVQLANIESTGRFALYYDPDADLVQIDLTVTLKTKYDSKMLLANVETFDMNGGTVTFDKVVKYSNTTFKTGTKPDFLLSTDQQINAKITFSKVSKDKPKGFQLHYELVDALCSVYTQLTDVDTTSMVNVLLPNTTQWLQSLSSYRCLNVFEHKTQEVKLSLNLEKFSFINSADMITVLDGISYDSRTLAVIEPQFVDFWKRVNLVSSANKLWVLYNSPQVVNTTIEVTNQLGIKAQSQGGDYIFQPNQNYTSLKLDDKLKTILPVIFTFETDSQNQLVIDFDEQNPLPGNHNESVIKIYESSGLASVFEPIIELKGGSFPPDFVPSNTNQMKVEFHDIIFKLDKPDNIMNVKKTCHSTAKGVPSSYSPSGCEKMCLWLIPARINSNGTYVLKFSHMTLPAKDDTIKITQFGADKPKDILNLIGPIVDTNTFPDVILDANASYILYTKREKCDAKSVDSSQLFAVSVVYMDSDLITNSWVLKKDANKTIESLNYPNYYSIGNNQIWNVSSADNKTTIAFITFNDLSLNTGHYLEFASSISKIHLKDTDVLSQTADSLLSFPFLGRFNVTDHSKAPYTGRGFNAALWPLSCGEYVKLDPKKGGSLKTPEKLDGILQCVWIVTAAKSDKLNVIQFTKNVTKDIDEKQLQIYDSNTIRDGKVVNMTLFTNTTPSSSTDTLVIVYNVDPNKKANLSMSFTQTECVNLCDNKKRCLLHEFYCNNKNDCGDWSDELGCNGTQPSPPPPTPEKIFVHSGVNGWVVTLVICPLFAGLGVLGTLYGPRLLGRFGRGRYREFQDFSEVS
ncbi:unnamed protein product, partial [Oppiella nova]